MNTSPKTSVTNKPIISQQTYEEAFKELKEVKGSMQSLTKGRRVMQLGVDEKIQLNGLADKERRFLRIIAQGPTLKYQGRSLDSRESRQFLKGEYQGNLENYKRIKSELDVVEKQKVEGLNIDQKLQPEEIAGLRTEAESILKNIDVPHIEGELLPTEDFAKIIEVKEQILNHEIQESDKALEALAGPSQETAINFKTAVDEYALALNEEKKEVLQESIHGAYEDIDLGSIQRDIKDFDSMKVGLIDWISNTEDSAEKENLEEKFELVMQNIDKLKMLYDIATRCGAIIQDIPVERTFINNLSERLNELSQRLGQVANIPLGIMIEGAAKLKVEVKEEDKKISEAAEAVVVASYIVSIIESLSSETNAMIDAMQSGGASLNNNLDMKSSEEADRIIEKLIGGQ